MMRSTSPPQPHQTDPSAARIWCFHPPPLQKHTRTHTNNYIEKSKRNSGLKASFLVNKEVNHNNECSKFERNHFFQEKTPEARRKQPQLSLSTKKCCSSELHDCILWEDNRAASCTSALEIGSDLSYSLLLRVFKTQIFLPFTKAAQQIVLSVHLLFTTCWKKSPSLYAEPQLHHCCSYSKKRLKWKTAPCLQAFLNNGLIFPPLIIALDKYQVCRIII